MTSSSDSPRRLSRTVELTLAAAGAAAAAALLIYGLSQLFRLAGDEPPVRVRNGGSIHLELETADPDVEWMTQPKNEWSHNGGLSSSSTIWMKLDLGNGKTCEPITGSFNIVRVTGSTGNKLHFNRAVWRLRSKGDHLCKEKEKLLSTHGGQDEYVQEIQADGWKCSFANNKELVALKLCATETDCK